VIGRLARAVRRLRSRAGGAIDHEIAPGVTIRLPADHRLPEYQRAHPLYDRFLPRLAAALPAGAHVVDVGANVGDTLAAMHAANPTLTFTCIEPDPRFCDYLDTNIARLRARDPGLQVTVERAMVGKAVASAALAGGGGTAHAEPGQGLATTTLDVLVIAPVVLLKSDVDGYDWDVIDSADAVIGRDAPLLFFECLLDTAAQKAGFEATIARLATSGYDDWSVFDNFGALLLRAASPASLLALLDYVWEQNQGRASRTIWYVDVLAAVPRDRTLIDRLLARIPG
jgi:FkbM family methyltransferase